MHQEEKQPMPTLKPNTEKSAIDFLPKSKYNKKIMHERAKLLSALAIDKTQNDQALAYILFRLGNKEHYGIPYEYVKEVMHHQSITKIPYVPKFIHGTINRNGKLIAIIDLKEFFHLPYQEFSGETYIIVVLAKDMTIGFIADDIIGSATYEKDLLEPPLVFDTAIKPDYLIGLHQGTIGIINVETILVDCMTELKQEQL